MTEPASKIELREKAIRWLRAEKAQCERLKSHRKPGQDALYPDIHQRLFNQTLDDLKQAGEEVPDWLYSQSGIVPANKRAKRNYDGVSLLGHCSDIDRALARFDPEVD